MADEIKCEFKHERANQNSQRFQEVGSDKMRQAYLRNAAWEELGKPQEIEITIKAKQ